MSNGKQRKAEVFRHTVRPGIRSPMFLKTVPGAMCLLRPPEDPDPGTGLKFFADADGIICLHVRPPGETEDVAKFVIECHADGHVTHYPLELRSGWNETQEMPFPEQQRPARKESGTIRPALSEEEMQRLSQQELLERGYPPRPDPEASGPHKAWRSLVSAPITMVKPGLLTNTGVRSQLTYSNWSGFQLRNGLFNLVTGAWNVPYAILGEPNTEVCASFWAGMSDANNVSLLQAGTESRLFTGFGNWTFHVYYAFSEYLPPQQSEQVITNLPVNPGDKVSVLIALQSSGNQAVTFFTNISTNEGVYFFIDVGSTFGYGQAEWIMERPTINNTESDLAGYFLATMNNAWAALGTTDGGTASYGAIDLATDSPFPGLESEQITMKNGNDVLSQVFPDGELSMFFMWMNFH